MISPVLLRMLLCIVFKLLMNVHYCHQSIEVAVADSKISSAGRMDIQVTSLANLP